MKPAPVKPTVPLSALEALDISGAAGREAGRSVEGLHLPAPLGAELAQTQGCQENIEDERKDL